MATAGVLSGGIFNIFGDYFFVFTCDMGAFGAGLATAIGTVISVIIMLSHFFTRKNSLRLVRPQNIFGKLRKICVTGFSTFFIDIAMGVLTILFNRQIMAYLGTNALSVYGVIVNVSTFVQCCAYSVGQASQPIISTNFGAGKGERIRETLKYALGTIAFFGIVWTVLCQVIPNQFIRLFMSPTEEVLQIAPAIVRRYGLSFLLLAAEYFFDILFPGRYEADCGICGIHIARIGHQRHTYSSASNRCRGKFHMVLHAHYGIARGCLRDMHDCALYKTIAHRKEGVT